MMRLNEILQYFKASDVGFANYYIGRMNTIKDNSLGIYNLRGTTGEYMAIGGEACTKSKNKYLSLLVHGNKNKVQTETLAYNLYDFLLHVRGAKVGEHEINYIRLLSNEPIDVDMDEQGVYEYVIELQLYYT